MLLTRLYDRIWNAYLMWLVWCCCFISRFTNPANIFACRLFSFSSPQHFPFFIHSKEPSFFAWNKLRRADQVKPKSELFPSMHQIISYIYLFCIFFLSHWKQISKVCWGSKMCAGTVHSQWFHICWWWPLGASSKPCKK